MLSLLALVVMILLIVVAIVAAVLLGGLPGRIAYGSKTQLNEESHRLLGLTSQFEHRIVAGVVDPKM